MVMVIRGSGLAWITVPTGVFCIALVPIGQARLIKERRLKAVAARPGHRQSMQDRMLERLGYYTAQAVRLFVYVMLAYVLVAAIFMLADESMSLDATDRWLLVLFIPIALVLSIAFVYLSLIFLLAEAVLRKQGRERAERAEAWECSTPFGDALLRRLEPYLERWEEESGKFAGDLRALQSVRSFVRSVCYTSGSCSRRRKVWQTFSTSSALCDAMVLSRAYVPKAAQVRSIIAVCVFHELWCLAGQPLPVCCLAKCVHSKHLAGGAQSFSAASAPVSVFTCIMFTIVKSLL